MWIFLKTGRNPTQIHCETAPIWLNNALKLSESYAMHSEPWWVTLHTLTIAMLATGFISTLYLRYLSFIVASNI